MTPHDPLSGLHGEDGRHPFSSVTCRFPRSSPTWSRLRFRVRVVTNSCSATSTACTLRRIRVSAGSRSWFKTALRDAELELMTLHDLRHTAASLAIRSGGECESGPANAGHASAAMTLDIYADLFDDDLDNVAMRLDAVVSASDVGKMWANANRPYAKTLEVSGIRGVSESGDGGI